MGERPAASPYLARVSHHLVGDENDRKRMPCRNNQSLKAGSASSSITLSKTTAAPADSRSCQLGFDLILPENFWDEIY